MSLPAAPFRGVNPAVYLLTRAAAKIVLAPFFRMLVEGREHLLPRGPLVLLCKHQRWQDIPLLGLAAPWPLYYVAKHELFIHPIPRWYLSAMGGVPLNRQKPLRSRNSIRNIVTLTQRGQRIVLFPEGTYYKGKMGPGHLGMIRAIHARVRVPFIPVGVHYGQGRLVRPVKIRFGQPLRMEGSTSLDAFLARAMREIANLSGLPWPPDAPVARS